ncbi:NADP-dependent oxidoreductase [Pokkaliibacter sp. CJK22405]|uniref:NADP-dependent oxidoreductase n=1 Tax=Pokkaliibacter sp. CJK22405 TaxID=3384615 RepID=UPI00398528B6
MQPQSMKAVQLHTFGGPDVLRFEEAPVPVVGPDEVLVKVRAVGINPPDWYLRDGYKMLPPEWQPAVEFPLIPGTDIAGEVVSLGEAVTGFAVGDAVYSMVRFPEGLAGESRAYAEYVAVPAHQLGHKPSAISDEEAAAAPMSLLTAWQFLMDLGHNEANPLQAAQHQPVALKGKRVLINGAAGGVGHFLVQIAKWQGAHVVAVASGAHEAFLRELGADEFIDYTTTSVTEAVDPVDLVVDAVGGAHAEGFIAIINRGGALFPIFPLGFDGFETARHAGVNVSTTQVRSNGAQLDELAKLLEQGIIKVTIDSQYPLAQATQAHIRAAKGHIRGKLVLTV